MFDHAHSPESEDRPKPRSQYVTEKTYIKRQLKMLAKETRKANALLALREKLARVQADYERAMVNVQEGDMRPKWARQP